MQPGCLVFGQVVVVDRAAGQCDSGAIAPQRCVAVCGTAVVLVLAECGWLCGICDSLEARRMGCGR